MDLTPNPPWVDRILNKHWRELEAKVGAAMMPVGEVPSGKRKATYKEYGCGHYGCVMPTRTDDVVCKVTSDVSERDFVRTCMEQGWEWPEGIVQYHAMAVLDDSHLKRPVAVLWRQEANNLGLSLHAWRGMSYDETGKLKMARMLLAFRDVAGALRERHKRRPEWTTAAIDGSSTWPAQGYWSFDWRDLELVAVRGDTSALESRIRNAGSGVRATTVLLQGLLLIVEWMRNDSQWSQPIGDALGFYLSKGICLADVHIANVGMIISREGSGTHLAIVDPGHAVFLGAPLEW